MVRKTELANKGNYGNVRDLSNIKYIVVHYTGNDGDTDEANANYFKGSNRHASAHYFVDDDSITQSVPDNYIAWHCGGSKYFHPNCRNANSIGVEMCDTQRNGKADLSKGTRANTIKLIKELMEKYNISINNVVRHYDVTHKCCPSYFVNDTNAWNRFKQDITNTSPCTKPNTSKVGNDIIAEGQAEANKFVKCSISCDGIRGVNTKKAAIMVLQKAMNKDYNSGLVVDGIFGNNTKKALGSHYVKYGEKQYMVTAMEILLMLKGYDPNGVEYPGVFGNGALKALRAYRGVDICTDFIFKSLIE